MALGVLNNVTALYAANNLNNTNNSLQTVLQQLSSGSKINSGSDDAAGLSLVNGLQANSTALAQSSTNATEGVGLLQVADGALSQVNSLLNRAVTLATETANGTLTSTQSAAAEQEYSSILSEINNIGATTTYNSNQVFSGTSTSIYTGDASSTGASVDSLYFAPLTSATVGDSGGTVVQTSSGSFFDLSKYTGTVTNTAGQSSDTITGGLSFVVTTDGTANTVTTTSTTVSGLVSEINKMGLTGISASLTTYSAAGLTGVGGTDDVGLLVSNASSNVTVSDNTLVDSTSASTLTTAQTSSKAIETISYQKGASESSTNLSSTDLNSAADAQSALTTINAAINNVSAERGYLGAQVNTLNAVVQVTTTQSENITSAQNAIQATDYSTATSEMSKYEILSQTGISALAQANSLQQEVTKLLQ
jgi:flagellin